MPFSDPERQKEFQRQWKLARRMDWVAEHGPCVDCGAWDNLQVDHIDKSQKIDHRVWSWRQDRRDAELAKCQVRCDPCHRLRHRPAHQPMHGTHYEYSDYGCRCNLCKAAHAESVRLWRQSR